jgi:hypothetical protein
MGCHQIVWLVDDDGERGVLNSTVDNATSHLAHHWHSGSVAPPIAARHQAVAATTMFPLRF